MIRSFALTAAILCRFVSAQSINAVCAPPPGGLPPPLPAKLLAGQGKITFAVTMRNPEAKRFFEQGLAQMHAFSTSEAERSFRQASVLEPDAPMPHWGIAMVAAGDYAPSSEITRTERVQRSKERGDYTRPTGAVRALAAANRARSIAVKRDASTRAERAYIQAIYIRRSAAGPESDDAYIRSLRQIIRDYPNEVEARLYLALQLMDGYRRPDGAPVGRTLEALSMLRQLQKSAPDHPGVHHYLMHAVDGSRSVEVAFESCRRYPQLVPGIAHALHFPAHIWSESGRWDLAERSLVEANELELRYMSEDQTYDVAGYAHNLHMLVVTYCHLNRFEDAVAAAQKLYAVPENPREQQEIDGYKTPHRQGWFALLRTLVYFGHWEGLLTGTLRTPTTPRENVWFHWARAIALAVTSNPSRARSELQLFRSGLKALSSATGAVVPLELRVAELDLSGALALSEGKEDYARKQLQAARTAERSLPVQQPPPYPRPLIGYGAAHAEASLERGRHN